MFAGFSDERIEVGGLALRVRHCAGDGPPVVLLHGAPAHVGDLAPGGAAAAGHRPRGRLS